MPNLLANIPVSKVMSVVYPTSPENTVSKAYALMQGKHLDGLPVVENSELVGVITRSDINKIDFSQREKTKVKDIMSKQPITIGSEEKVSTALEKMIKLKIGKMPVISTTGALLGWLSLGDIDTAVKTLK